MDAERQPQAQTQISKTSLISAEQKLGDAGRWSFSQARHTAQRHGCRTTASSSDANCPKHL